MRSVDALRQLVRAQIVASGRTQRSVCRAIGISPTHLSQFLAGDRGMSWNLIDRVLAEVGRKLALSTTAVLAVPQEGERSPLVDGRQAQQEACWRAAQVVCSAMEQGWPGEQYGERDFIAVSKELLVLVHELERRGGGSGG